MIRSNKRPIFRAPVLLLIVVFVLSMLFPGLTFAKVDRKNGHKGTDGDPIDGFDSPAAGGSGNIVGNSPGRNYDLPEPENHHVFFIVLPATASNMLYIPVIVDYGTTVVTKISGGMN